MAPGSSVQVVMDRDRATVQLFSSITGPSKAPYTQFHADGNIAILEAANYLKKTRSNLEIFLVAPLRVVDNVLFGQYTFRTVF